MAGVLDRIKKALGLSTLPAEVSAFYRGAKSEREALLLLREARHRDEERRGRAMADIDILLAREKELLAQGRQEKRRGARVQIARRIKDVRARIADINHKIAAIYNKRLTIYAEHIRSLETLVDIGSEPLPDAEALQEAALRAREQLERLDGAVAAAEGVALTRDPAGEPVDAEEKDILAELEGPAKKRLRKTEVKAEADDEEPAPRSRLRPPERKDRDEERLLE